MSRSSPNTFEPRGLSFEVSRAPLPLTRPRFDLDLQVHKHAFQPEQLPARLPATKGLEGRIGYQVRLYARRNLYGWSGIDYALHIVPSRFSDRFPWRAICSFSVVGSLGRWMDTITFQSPSPRNYWPSSLIRMSKPS